MAVLLAAGALAWFPPRWHWRVTSGILVLTAAASVYAIVALLWPSYGPPREPSRAELDRATPLEADLGGATRILGYHLAKTTVKPGDTLEVTVYWLPEAATDAPLTVFAQVFVPDVGVVAQADVYPGGGTYPTNRWTPGRMFEDTYYLHIPADAPAAAQAADPVRTVRRAERPARDGDRRRRGPRRQQLDPVRDGQHRAMSTSRAGRLTPRFDPGLAVALVFAAGAAWPLLSHASLPSGTDGIQHLYRAYEILAAWREGIFFTRWAPDFYYSYGYPVFNFYAPFTHYLAAAYGWFWGPVAGVKFVMVLSTFVGTAGVYLFGKEHWGALPAAVSAAVYASAPYIALTEPIIRGAMPEAFAIGLGPIVLSASRRLARTGSRRFFALAAVSLAILMASHNLLSFVLIGFTAAWIMWDIVALHTPTSAAG